jgi:osmotically-inducible protein OsmY
MNHKFAIGLLAATFAISGAAIAADTKDTRSTADTKGSSKGTDVKGSVKNAASEVKETVSDSIITTKIKGEFAKDKTVSAMNIHVDTDQKGMVTLTGNAKSKAEADKAESIAKGTQGVVSVKNNITVGAAKSEAKSEAKADAKADAKTSTKK